MKIGMLFSGYGNQFVGMAKELYDEFRIVQEYFEQASNCLDVNFVRLCFASSDAELKALPSAYTSLFLVCSAIYALLKEHGIKADSVAGYNIGEYAALHAAGSLSLPDGLYLLSKHVLFYKELLSSLNVCMRKIQNIDIRDLLQICKEVNNDSEQVFIAVYESAQAYVVVGHIKAIAKLEDMVSSYRGSKIKMVDVSGGLYCQFMKPVIDHLSMYLEKVDFKDATIPLIATDRAAYITRSNDIKNFFITQFISPILWSGSMELFAGYDLIIEVGPGKQLSNIVNQRYPNIQTIAINTRADLEQLHMMIGE
jgi:[acyl-carrier-protein] S-malonyltransferase